jgi:hypothetical protein
MFLYNEKLFVEKHGNNVYYVYLTQKLLKRFDLRDGKP